MKFNHDLFEPRLVQSILQYRRELDHAFKQRLTLIQDLVRYHQHRSFPPEDGTDEDYETWVSLQDEYTRLKTLLREVKVRNTLSYKNIGDIQGSMYTIVVLLEKFPDALIESFIKVVKKFQDLVNEFGYI